MLSIKLHEATKQFKISNKLAMFFLEKINAPVKSHSSVITMDQLEMLREFCTDKDKHPKIREEFERLENEKKQKSPTMDDRADLVEEPIVETKPTPAHGTREPHTSQPHTQPKPQPTIPRNEQRPRPEQRPDQRQEQRPPQQRPEQRQEQRQEQRPQRPEQRYEQRPEQRQEQRQEQRPQRPEQRFEQRSEQRQEQRQEQRPQRPEQRYEQRPDQRQEQRPPQQRSEQRHPQRPEQRQDQRPQRPAQRPEQRQDQRPQRPEQRYEQRHEQRQEQRPPQHRPEQRPDQRQEQRPEQRTEPRQELKPEHRNQGKHEAHSEQKPTPKRDQRPEQRTEPQLDNKTETHTKPTQLHPKRETTPVKLNKPTEFTKKIPPVRTTISQEIFEEVADLVTDDLFIPETMLDDSRDSKRGKAKKDKNKNKPKQIIDEPLYEDDHQKDVVVKDKGNKVFTSPTLNKFSQERRPAPVENIPKKPKVKILNLPGEIETSNFVNIKELAEKLNVKLKDIEEKMSSLGKDIANVTNQFLDIQDIKDICAAFNVEVAIVSYEDDLFHNHIKKANATMTSRAPVVTVMGHVDHGKTTLLDTLRNTRVADREAGGITQKIGAYQLNYKGNDIVFIDTPGHEAFTNIRARGTQVTDIVILVVAANDGVKPQTIEAINHAQAAKVPILVAINKIDMPSASPDKVKQELTQHNIVVEDWGGDVVSVAISAKHNQNLDSLLEMLTLIAEMQEIKSYKNVPGRGTIIESRLDAQLGPLGTVLLQHGKIQRGDYFICGNSIGRIKSIFDDKGKVLASAEVPQPVEIMGFDNIPEAGELFQVTDDIDKARKVVESRKMQEREPRTDETATDQKLSLQSLFQRLAEDKAQVFSILMKTDNYSSMEVLESILMKHDQEKMRINIIHKGIGNISESDILLASTSGAIIIAFNVKVPSKLVNLAKRERVEIKLYNVIYHLIEDIAKAIKGEMAPEYIETRIGSVEVLQTFKISKLGIIAGCLVKEGKVTAKSKVKIYRKNDLVFEGELETLRRVKNEASEVNAGTECGIKIKNFNSIEIGDTIEIFETTLKVTQ